MKKKIIYSIAAASVFLLGVVSIVPLISTAPVTDKTAYVEPASFKSEESLKTRMMQNFWRSEKLSVVFGKDLASASDMESSPLRQLRWIRYIDTVTTHSLQESEAGPSAHFQKKRALLLIGSIQNHPLIQTLLQQAGPFGLRNNGFVFDGALYQKASHSLLAMLPNPVHPEWPVFIITGNDTEHLMQHVPSRGLVFDYQIMDDNQRLQMGALHYTKSGVSIDEKQRYHLEKDLKLAGRNERAMLYVHKFDAMSFDTDSLLATIKQRYERISQFTGKEKDQADPLRYYVFSSFEDQALVSGKMEFAAVNYSDQTVYTVRDHGFYGDQLGAETYLILRNLLGKPRFDILETGLKMYFTPRWHQQEWKTMASRIVQTGKDLELGTLFDNKFWEQQSGLWAEPVSGMLVSFLIEEWGRETFLKFYENKKAEIDPKAWADEWNSYLKRWTAKYPPVTKNIGNDLPGFLRGFNFSHEGYQITNGYGSKIADQSLDQLVALGANTVAINPFGYVPETKNPVPVRFSNRAGSENDPSVVHTILSSRSKGLTALLKPHIWIRGSWPGEIGMNTEAEWEQFFSYYEQWIRHYAIMAQLYEAEIFSMGLEMTQVTTTHPDNFVAMAKRMRRLYDGKLTYAANWYGEFDKISIWESFDFIGLDSYFPLSKESESSLEQLISGAEEVAGRIEKVAKKFNKKVLVTEIGFTSTRAPWINPHEYGQGKEVVLKDQFKSYEAIRLAWQDEPWLKGIYWWKWPTEPEREGSMHSGFTPRQKPAERVVENWFKSE